MALAVAPAISPARRRPAARTVALAGLASLPLMCAIVGATAARPIADDYVFQAALKQSGNGPAAFAWGMTHWNGFYSHFAFMTAFAVAGRHVGIGAQYAAESFVMIGLLIASVTVVCRSFLRRADSTIPLIVAVPLVAAGLLGSYDLLVSRSSPALFGALYWMPGSVPHLFPVLLLPIALALAVRWSGRRAAAGLAAAGAVLAGFGYAESVTIVAGVVATGWGLWRLDGRQRLWTALPGLCGLAVGTGAGAIVSYVLPGTARRHSALTGMDFGLSTAHGSALVHGAAQAAGLDLVWALLSPAPLIGLAVGFGLQRLGTNTPRSDAAGFASVTARATGGVAVVGWLAVAAGDTASHTAWWHVLPLWALSYAAFALLGWQIGAQVRSPLKGTAVLALAAAVAWSSALTASAASAAWARRPVFDHDLTAARAAGLRPGAPVTWVAMSVGDIHDAQPTDTGDAWITDALAGWIGVPPRALSLRTHAPAGATIAMSGRL